MILIESLIDLVCIIQFTWTKRFEELHKPQPRPWQQPSPYQRQHYQLDVEPQRDQLEHAIKKIKKKVNFFNNPP